MNTIEKTPPEAIKSFIDDRKGRIGVAFSGGADSLALLAGVCEIRDPKEIVALYVNHRLRDEEELKAECAQQEERRRSAYPDVLIPSGTVEDL